MSRWIFEFRQQWTGLFTPTNWTDFTFVHLEIEHDQMLGNWNGTIALLGFSLFWRYTYDDQTKACQDMRASLRDMGIND